MAIRPNMVDSTLTRGIDKYSRCLSYLTVPFTCQNLLFVPLVYHLDPFPTTHTPIFLFKPFVLSSPVSFPPFTSSFSYFTSFLSPFSHILSHYSDAVPFSLSLPLSTFLATLGTKLSKHHEIKTAFGGANQRQREERFSPLPPASPLHFKGHC